MKISIDFPPNISELSKHFVLRPDVVFTYGDTIYAPGSNGYLPKHLIAHEERHYYQQIEIGIEEWWKKYIADKDFRLAMELEAYATQVIEVKKSKGYKQVELFIAAVAKDLSSDLYGNIITFNEAIKLIKDKVKLYETNTK